MLCIYIYDIGLCVFLENFDINQFGNDDNNTLDGISLSLLDLEV